MGKKRTKMSVKEKRLDIVDDKIDKLIPKCDAFANSQLKIILFLLSLLIAILIGMASLSPQTNIIDLFVIGLIFSVFLEGMMIFIVIARYKKQVKLRRYKIPIELIIISLIICIIYSALSIISLSIMPPDIIFIPLLIIYFLNGIALGAYLMVISNPEKYQKELTKMLRKFTTKRARKKFLLQLLIVRSLFFVTFLVTLVLTFEYTIALKNFIILFIWITYNIILIPFLIYLMMLSSKKSCNNTKIKEYQKLKKKIPKGINQKKFEKGLNRIEKYPEY
jgi:hypothetical protein